MKKVISYILILSVLFSLMVTKAFAESQKISVLKGKNLINASFNGTKLVIKEKGSVQYNDVSVAFQFGQIEFAFDEMGAGASTVLTASIAGNTYTAELSDTNKVLKIENPTLIMGTYNFGFEFSNAITVSEIKIKSCDTIYSYYIEPDLSAYEKAIQTALIISSNSPVFLVNGGRRYVNNDDPRELPYVENGEIYLPIHTFSRAMGYYYEIKGSEWILSKNQYTFHYKDGALTQQIYEGDMVAISNMSKTVNSKLYIPLKYFAELEGKQVVKSGKIYIIEKSAYINEILKTANLDELKNNFNNWAIEEKTGKTYYVSKKCISCNDNDGTKEKPFKTIAKASSVAEPGDTIIIDGGVYYETLTPQTDGTVSNPITYKAAEGETVQISAIADLGSPIAEENGMLVYNAFCDLGYGRNQLFYDSKYLVEGRYPNTDTNPNKNILPDDLSKVWPIQGNMSVRRSENNDNLIFSDTDLKQADDRWNGATVVTLEGMGWTLGTGKVKDSTNGKLTIGEHNFRWWFGMQSGDEDFDSDYAFITNHKNTIDLPGEWAYDNGKFYIMPPQGENAETLRVAQKVRQLAINLENRKYIRIEGIDTIGGGIKMTDSEMCMLNGGKYEYISHYTYAGDQQRGNISATLLGEKTPELKNGELGIYVSGKDNIIVNNSIEYSAAAAIVLTGCYTYIENNYVSDCGYMGSYVSGIVCMADPYGTNTDPRGGHAIYQNTLRRAGRRLFGVSTHEEWLKTTGYLTPFIPYELAYNDIYDGSLTTRDSGNVYSYGVSLGTERLKSKDHHNLVWDSWANEGSKNALLYYDGYVSNVESYSNVLFTTQSGFDTDFHYVQKASGAVSNTDVWGNSEVGIVAEGKSGLTMDDYPDGKVFGSGVDWLLKDSTPYINSLNNPVKIYKVKDATVSGGTVTDGMFVPGGDGAVIEFTDVDFGNLGSEANAIEIYYTGDPSNTGDKVQLVIGNSLTDYSVNLTPVFTADTPDATTIDTQTVEFVSGITGKHNVYLVFKDYVSMNVKQIKIKRISGVNANTFVSVYADEYSNKVTGYPSKNTTETEYGHSYVKNTDKAGLLYKNVVFPTDCNELTTRMGSATTFGNQPMSIYIRTENGDQLIAKTYTPINGWENFSKRSVKLDTPVPAGTYDLYVYFGRNEDEPDVYKSCNFLWFGFGYNSEYVTE